jgi:hypothetical protein
MNLPKIDISTLPDLDTLTGMFGSLAHQGTHFSVDDAPIDMMVIVYEILKALGQT